MSTHTPDRWVIVEIAYPDMTFRRVLGGWGGGYLDADEWRMSSPIVEIVDAGDFWEVRNESGGTYRCRKGGEGFTGLSAQIYANLEETAKAKDDVTVRVVEMAAPTREEQEWTDDINRW
jgi:hypothetical protein